MSDVLSANTKNLFVLLPLYIRLAVSGSCFLFFKTYLFTRFLSLLDRFYPLAVTYNYFHIVME